MELYFARFGLIRGGNVDTSLLLTRASDISHWMEERGFQITRYSEKHFPTYDTLEKSLARYGILFPSNDIVVDLSVRKRGRLKLTVDLASNDRQMIYEVFSGIKKVKPRLKVEQDITPVENTVLIGDFRKLEHVDEEKRITSVAELKKFLRIR